MKRYILILEDQIKDLEKDYLKYSYYFDSLDDARAAAEKIPGRSWLMKTAEYIYYINHKIYGAKAKILWQSTK